MQKIIPTYTIAELQQQFFDYLNDVKHTQAPQSLYEPIDYMLQMGGKRIRPVACLLGCQLFSDEIKNALPAALGIEFFHNFSLVHDDIMDAAPLRRGNPTVHQKYNLNTAILSGDLILVKAYYYVAQVPKLHLSKVLSIFNQVATQVCEGQQYDMDYETQTQVTVADYINMISLKTAVLLAASLQIGATIASAPVEEAIKLYEFGKNLGIAFQLQDDILDVYGQQQKVGKQVGGDIIQNKKTYLLLKALELAQGTEFQDLNKWLTIQNGDNKAKVDAIIAIYNKLKIKDKAIQVMESYHQKALKNLEAIQVSDAAKKPLLDLAAYLLKRQF